MEKMKLTKKLTPTNNIAIGQLFSSSNLRNLAQKLAYFQRLYTSNTVQLTFTKFIRASARNQRITNG